MSDEGQRMPDSPEVRLNHLERETAGFRSELDALRQRADAQDTRVREIYPTVELYGRLDERLSALAKDVNGAHESLRDLRKAFDDDHKERERIRRDREEKERERELADRRARVIQWIMLAALLVSAISSTVAVITVSGGAAG